MIQCEHCKDDYPSECMCLTPDDRIVCQWCARQIRDKEKQFRFICEWCKEPGVKIGDAYHSCIIVKCTSCHHEWMTVEDKEND